MHQLLPMLNTYNQFRVIDHILQKWPQNDFFCQLLHKPVLKSSSDSAV